ncbi:aspartate--ammonia ligase [Gemmiger formicilis]|uniref:aspartate--ammonia ligase n=1 Tax=Gemmiger formicilis TaxID=745368 RepID=UPI00195E1E69|nr:aspartate--ammonia ligase [Gemmiger formicilis]MBM6914807.1 aspartate--ammonia ligase [Gemmiger formicilis]
MKKAYTPVLGLYDTQKAIGFIKQTFQQELARRLSLSRVTAPLFVDPATGLNDDLNGVERPVSFDIPAIPTLPAAQVVHSLAKWKRMALGRYGFAAGTGLYTDMNAIRRDEELDALHSVYVDQWDWEKVITRETRTVEQLKETVRQIVVAVCDTLDAVKKEYPALPVELSREVSFVTTQELEDRWPDKTPKEREDAWLQDHPTAFVMQIGGALKSGQKHDGRAPDYDDWALNGDILFWNSVLGHAFEVSSMGIRVDAESMRRQCELAGCPQRLELPFHKAVLDGTLPLTMGGGIGQSRLCMLLLGKAHIGEVQVSLWPQEMVKVCEEAGIPLL